MASLIQIFLRPKCRTIKGFCELIVREWLIRGHPFCERFGQVLSDADGYTSQEVCLIFK
jgi:myotubularin-related protein 5/13